MNEKISKALATLPSGLFVVSTAENREEKTPYSFLASFVQQVSFEPPLVSVSVETKRYDYGKFALNSRVTIHPLDKNDKKAAKVFASADEKKIKNEFSVKKTSEDFAAIEELPLRLYTRVRNVLKTGARHSLVVCEVEGAELGRDEHSNWIHHRERGDHY